MAKKRLIGIVIGGLGLLLASAPGWTAAAGGTPINPCVGCHAKETPGVVLRWQRSKHGQLGVKCYVCHWARKIGDTELTGDEHDGFRIVTHVPPRYCESCHPKQAVGFKKRLRREGARLVH